MPIENGVIYCNGCGEDRRTRILDRGQYGCYDHWRCLTCGQDFTTGSAGEQGGQNA